MVVTSTPATVTVATPDSPTASARVSTLVTADAYTAVVMAMLVIGNVYAHHASEKRTPRNRLRHTTSDLGHVVEVAAQPCPADGRDARRGDEEEEDRVVRVELLEKLRVDGEPLVQRHEQHQVGHHLDGEYTFSVLI
jgi:hypothetical protein